MAYSHRQQRRSSNVSQQQGNGFQPGGGSNQDMLAMISSAQQGSYQVRPGDSLWAIAKDLGVGLTDLMAANGLNKWSIIHPGQQISIPGAGQRSTASAEVSSYRVKPGDSLWAIAQDHGVSLYDLQAANPQAGSIIHPGLELRIPGGSSPSSSQSSSQRSTQSGPQASSSRASQTAPAMQTSATKPQTKPEPQNQSQNQGYDPALGTRLAQASLAETAGRTRSQSDCYHYVANAVDRVIGKFLYGRHAYMAAAQLAAKKDLFTETSAGDLRSLPAGAIVVWGKGTSKSGHISVAQGDGMETSDFKGTQMTYHYGGAPARVFLPKGVMR